MDSACGQKTFIITNDLRVRVENIQLDTKIVIENLQHGNDSQVKCSAFMDFDKWMEFKKNFIAIDNEFNERFKYQYATC